MTVSFTDDEARELVSEILQNLPEYSCSMVCSSFDYDAGIYKFIDEEDDGKKYTLDMDKAVAGFQKLVSGLNDKSIFIGLSIGEVDDAANWDIVSTDALIQLSLFGEIIYG